MSRIAGLALASLLTAAITAQQPIFRTGVTYVEVDAVVTDKDGKFVRGLTKDDFQIKEDGKPQEITVASLVDLPIELSVPAAGGAPPAKVIVPDVASNVAQAEGRLYLIVLDAMHVDGNRTPNVRRRAREFIETYVSANDRAAVVHLANPRQSQEFTSNKALLVASVQKFIGEKMESGVVVAANADPDMLEGGRRADAWGGARARMGGAALGQMTELVRYFGEIPGRRKAMLLFSEGFDADLTAAMSDSGIDQLSGETARLFAEAMKANVSIYTIETRGVATIGDELMQIVGMPTSAKSGGNINPATPTPGLALWQQLAMEQGSMRYIADNTGGLAVVGTNDFAKNFAAIVDDNSTYYVLGYYSSVPAADGRFHALDVKVTRPGLTVRARKGYYTARASDVARAAADPMNELIHGPISRPGFGMHVTAAPIGPAPGPDKKSLVHLTLEIDGADLSFRETDGAFTNDLDVVYEASNQIGEMKAASRDAVKLKLRRETRDAARDFGFRYTTEFALPPGLYQVRIGGREQVGGQAGSVHFDLEVPDFRKAGPVMSGVVLTTDDARRLPSAAKDDSLKARLKTAPTTARAFDAAGTLGVHVEVFAGGLPADVEVVTVLTDSTGRDVFHRAAPGGDVEVPLDGLAAGRYVLTMSARTATRQVAITVR